ncbi:DedA family protein [Bacillus sp. 2205SS5-2]|uniref:DedA family protein n=1 Tax=Bacillus sp. 2205SS5-2 TaxID=3109031 RepID=UPI003006A0FF
MEEYITNIVLWLGNWNYIGIALLLMIEVIPSEIVLSYGGYLVSTNQIHFLGALVAGVVGGTLAQLFLYYLGVLGGRPFFEKYGKWLLISQKHLHASEIWFERYGNVVVFFARFIPIVRHAISIPAGVSRMNARSFTVYTIGAMIPWTVLFLLLGMKLGQHWVEIETIAGPYVKPVISFALFSLLLFFLWNYQKRK